MNGNELAVMAGGLTGTAIISCITGCAVDTLIFLGVASVVLVIFLVKLKYWFQS